MAGLLDPDHLDAIDEVLDKMARRGLSRRQCARTVETANAICEHGAAREPAAWRIERRLVGAAALDPDVADFVVRRTAVDHFTDPIASVVRSAIEELRRADQPVDFIPLEALLLPHFGTETLQILDDLTGEAVGRRDEVDTLCRVVRAAGRVREAERERAAALDDLHRWGGAA